ncbi:general stress protein [Pseudonocardia sp. NPDC049154]|uniref:general stress protein n=1 Tax=Pseudonocardia sp. NPDC049154 TaxID=3155501 RepID=UPI00340AA7E2
MSASYTDDEHAARTGSQVLREFDSYGPAQELVDRLSDRGFPVGMVRIVGTGIRTVEQVTGRLTKARAAAAGAAGGAWFGLLVGLLFGLLAAGSETWVVAALFGGLVLGGVWGAAFGLVAHWATHGQRDFASVENLQAAHYAVEVEAGCLDEAARVAGIA